MATIDVKCPYCKKTDVSKNGKWAPLKTPEIIRKTIIFKIRTLILKAFYSFKNWIL